MFYTESSGRVRATFFACDQPPSPRAGEWGGKPSSCGMMVMFSFFPSESGVLGRYGIGDYRDRFCFFDQGITCTEELSSWKKIPPPCPTVFIFPF